MRTKVIDVVVSAIDACHSVGSSTDRCSAVGS